MDNKQPRPIRLQPGYEPTQLSDEELDRTSRLVTAVMDEVLLSDPLERYTLDEYAIWCTARYYALMDYNDTDITRADDKHTSETYMLYYNLKLLHGEGYIQYTDQYTEPDTSAPTPQS